MAGSGRRGERTARSRVERLDQPRQLRSRGVFGVPRPHYDPDAFGRFSEQIARFLGTARFLVYMSALIAAWLLWNNLAPEPLRFDPYTHTFLTLLLSLQASYAAPLILLAQNRQADRDRVNLDQDRAQDARVAADMEFLAREVAALRIALSEVATRDFLRSELRDLLEDLDRAGDGPERRDGHERGGGVTERGQERSAGGATDVMIARPGGDALGARAAAAGRASVPR